MLCPVPYLQSRSELERSKFRETLRARSESDQVTFYAWQSNSSAEVCGYHWQKSSCSSPILGYPWQNWAQSWLRDVGSTKRPQKSTFWSEAHLESDGFDRNQSEKSAGPLKRKNWLIWLLLWKAVKVHPLSQKHALTVY